MDIRDWGMDRIMQLPDWCFGRKWLVSVQATGSAIEVVFDISEYALPERCVIWQLQYGVGGEQTARGFISLALADFLPASDAAFDASEILLRDYGVTIAGRKIIPVSANGGVARIDLRMPIASAGRRLVGRLAETATATYYLWTTIVVSSVPTEVPDWLVSVPGS